VVFKKEECTYHQRRIHAVGSRDGGPSEGDEERENGEFEQHCGQRRGRLIKEGKGGVLCTEWKGLANDKLCLERKTTAGRVGNVMERIEEQLNEVSGHSLRLK
jgi:hypothetical protein